MEGRGGDRRGGERNGREGTVTRRFVPTTYRLPLHLFTYDILSPRLRILVHLSSSDEDLRLVIHISLRCLT